MIGERLPNKMIGFLGRTWFFITAPKKRDKCIIRVGCQALGNQQHSLMKPSTTDCWVATIFALVF